MSPKLNLLLGQYSFLKAFDPLTGQRFRIARVASRVETETGGHSSRASGGQVDRMTRRGSLSYAYFAS